MSFEALNLNNPLLNALADMGLETPTHIQEKTFPIAMSGVDIVGIAQTGTGKTFAYLLPCLRQWKFSKEKHPTVLILVPTRELVAQVIAEIEKLTAYMNLRVGGAYGGTNIKTQIAMLSGGLDFLVATPGRLLDLIFNGSLKAKAIKKLVIDEVDEMLNLGFRDQLTKVLDLLPPKRQNLMFSATMTEEVEELITKFFAGSSYVEAARAGSPLESISQLAYEVPNFNTKVNLLRLLMENTELSKVLVFTATKRLADQLFQRMEEEYPEKVGVIHSNKDQNFRFNSINQFEEGNYQLLIATDLVSRGMDISSVTHVINFDLPKEPENYIHRIGRTGRADKKGVAITFISPFDQALFPPIEELMDMEVTKTALPENLSISTELTADEMPTDHREGATINKKIFASSGPAFHEKKAKNQKVNVRRNHQKEMMKKYGKPRTKGPKRK